MTDRRHVLELLAATATTTLLASCASSGRGTEPLQDPAAAWRNPGSGQTDVRLYALAHAILAPNPHNRQPWLVTLDGENGLTLFFDTARRLPVTDPFDRQLAIGCGAFLELLKIAAAQQNYTVKITPFPEGSQEQGLDQRPVARITFEAGAQPDPLFGHIIARRSNKEKYDVKRPVTRSQLETLAQSVQTHGFKSAGVLAGEPKFTDFQTIMKSAYRREIETPSALKESVDLMRIGKAEIAQYRDGIDLDFPGLPAMVRLNIISRAKLMQPGTSAYKQGLSMYDPLAESAAGFMWLISPDNKRDTQLAAGQAYARLNLQATRMGIAMHPVSQSLQEYAEVAHYKQHVEHLAGLDGEQRLQMLVRIGYGPATEPAPRRGLEQHLRT